MPSSDAPPESRRSSLRRLSSIASFQVLNPFNRRRSNNATHSTAASSTSNLSLSSSTANAPQPLTSSTSSSNFFRTEDELTALPVPPIPSNLPSRRSSYICLPDDPIGGMPRSRTFSNLPLPTRARKNTPMDPSKSHSRLPSAVLPSTRLPSPAASNRKHSITRLGTTEQKQPLVRNRMKRSDTEPLLPYNPEQANNVGRSTAFKENLSLSPVKPLPHMSMLENKDLYGSSLPSRAYANRHGWLDPAEGSEPLLPDGTPVRDREQPNFASSLPLSSNGPHAHKPSFSSPAYRSFRDRAPTPGQPQPAQRWNSQPVLTNVTNRRHSRHGEIQERRLMSEVKPDPPPPPPKTPLTSEVLATGKKKASSSAGQLREPPREHSPSLARLSGKERAPSPKRGYGEIAKAEPVPYWCGRFAALNDRYRNEELAAHLNNPKAESDKMHSPEANTRRMRRALEHLHSLCSTPEAKESFVVFQLQFAALQGSPELSRPIQLNMPDRRIVLNRSEESVASASTPGTVSEHRKMSFMDRLLGRDKRSRRSLGG